MLYIIFDNAIVNDVKLHCITSLNFRIKFLQEQRPFKLQPPLVQTSMLFWSILLTSCSCGIRSLRMLATKTSQPEKHFQVSVHHVNQVNSAIELIVL